MSAKRAAAYLGASLLCAAWLTSAAGIVMRPASSEPDQTPAIKTSGTETLAAEVQAQAQRLRDRMASAPAPREPLRNPFAFAMRD